MNSLKDGQKDNSSVRPGTVQFAAPRMLTIGASAKPVLIAINDDN